MNVMQGFPVAIEFLHQVMSNPMSAQLQDAVGAQDMSAMTDLEATLELFRDTVETACGAAASLFVILPLDTDCGAPSVILASNTQLGRRLYKLAMTAFGSAPGMLNTSSRSEPVARCDIASFSFLDVNFDAVSFLVEGPDNGAVGLFSMAIPSSPSRQYDPRLTAQKIAACFRQIWHKHDSTSELAFELATLSSRMGRLQKLTETDPLTHLNNRSTFENLIRDRIESSQQDFAFVIIDVDHFKMINDIYGHQFGDIYLKTIARTLRNTAPEGTVSGRLGGDEFGLSIPLPRGGRSYLDRLLSRMRNDIQRAIAVLNKPDLGHVSIGACQFPLDAAGYTKLYELADCALYAAKNAGRGKSVIFHKSHHVRYNTRELGRLFHHAVRDNQIHPNFQPIVDLESKNCVGFEVLARWRDISGKNMIPA
ncbi:MAG: diguanylate cyclase, partial [Pseudomonadota bacterium]|nr:diguanylate cyclase [Pseudomonadota bacterium]